MMNISAQMTRAMMPSTAERCAKRSCSGVRTSSRSLSMEAICPTSLSFAQRTTIPHACPLVTTVVMNAILR